MSRVNQSSSVTELQAFKAKKHKEQIRGLIVNLVFVIYWLLIFEGALRKWVLPEIHQLLFFVRDPFAIAIYYFAAANEMLPKRSLLMLTGLSIAFASLVITCWQIFTDDATLILNIYGWRNYFLYIPLPFIIAEQFRKEDLYRLFKQTLLVAIPISLLVVTQVLSPADAVINQGRSDEAIFNNLGVAGEVLRAHGTFTSSAGQSPFVVSIVAMVLSIWLLPNQQRPLKGIPLIVASGAVVVNLGVSGSRTAFVGSIIVLTAALLGGFVMRNASKIATRAVFYTVTFVLVSIFLIPTFFPTILDAFVERWVGAYEYESQKFQYGIIGRAIADFTQFIDLMPDTPILGYGIGLAGNAAESLGMKLTVSSEDDWSRNIVELGPVLGFFFICYRIAIVVVLFKGAIASTRRSHNLLPLLLFSFIGITFLYGQITGHGSVNGYGWLFVGFCMAANQANLTERKTIDLVTKDVS
jgi:hypothetical protein